MIDGDGGTVPKTDFMSTLSMSELFLMRHVDMDFFSRQQHRQCAVFKGWKCKYTVLDCIGAWRYVSGFGTSRDPDKEILKLPGRFRTGIFFLDNNTIENGTNYCEGAQRPGLEGVERLRGVSPLPR